LAKLANQIIVAVNIAAVSEALQLAARGGADPEKVREAIRGGFAESRVLEIHGHKMINRDFETKARATMQLKDLRNALHVADQHSFITPTTRTVASLFEGLVKRVGETDHSALWTEIESINAAGPGAPVAYPAE
jgi:2-hydroxy-3-oxopropionate reductase